LAAFPLVVFLADQDKSKVGLICGGGSGHEPSHAGFVGKMIDWPYRVGSRFSDTIDPGDGMLTGNDNVISLAFFPLTLPFDGLSCRMW
jgi:hypothetical protein